MSDAALAPSRPLPDLLAAAREAVQRVIIGQSEAIDLALITVFSGGHALIEGVPGVAKTLLARCLARLAGTEFQRIQFTPDLMPADITGTNVFDLRAHEFRLLRGPIFTGFLLADEINRAPAKTQSALLEAMQERAVTIDRVSYPLPPHFTVFATQNPIEFQGTYPLAEAQKDRFLLRIPMGYPEADEERALALRLAAGEEPEGAMAAGAAGPAPAPVMSAEELMHARHAVSQVAISEPLCAYAVDLVRATRSHSAVLAGAGPRAMLGLVRASRALAALCGRDYVIPDDLKRLAAPVLGHRLILRPEFELEGASVSEIVRELLEKAEVPR
ncbi:MAG: AAA family ATPase [Terriglobales bacterium]